ncbi:NAD(P)-binding protein [Polyplosphaeria fusca]|uniref:NAD(P)-binding protein n=1 Tax=Polyplosphaeria fusca TaxID=682080 RepID=A0A9P4UYY7_9PLEO|nr:NAD(P)-binding protein [Polyplosphaeria fusca]
MQVFFIGATGHIGGALLNLLVQQYPSDSFTVLVRSPLQAEQLSAKYHVPTLLGSLEDVDAILPQIKEHQIVINCGPDTPFPAQVDKILKTLEECVDKRYYIHTSGAASIWEKLGGNKEGDKVWDDIEDVDTILGFPKEIPHGTIDKLVLSSNSKTLHVAIISPGYVEGLSVTIGRKTPLTFPDMFHTIQHLGAVYTVGGGLNLMSFMHVDDLVKLYAHLFASAVQGIQDKTVFRNEEIWGPKAYFFAHGVEMSWSEWMREFIAPALKKANAKFMKDSNEIKALSANELAEIVVTRLKGMPQAEAFSNAIAQGMESSMRIRSSRALKEFGWTAGSYLGVDEAVELYLAENA